MQCDNYTRTDNLPDNPLYLAYLSLFLRRLLYNLNINISQH